MRLIDADALKPDYIVGSTSTNTECYRYVSLKQIMNAPTADVRENVKGKWYKPMGMMPPEYAGVYRCSECDELAMRDWKTHKQKLTDYCPNCGAMMEWT